MVRPPSVPSRSTTPSIHWLPHFPVNTPWDIKSWPTNPSSILSIDRPPAGACRRCPVGPVRFATDPHHVPSPTAVLHPRSPRYHRPEYRRHMLPPAHSHPLEIRPHVSHISPLSLPFPLWPYLHPTTDQSTPPYVPTGGLQLIHPPLRADIRWAARHSSSSTRRILPSPVFPLLVASLSWILDSCTHSSISLSTSIALICPSRPTIPPRLHRYYGDSPTTFIGYVSDLLSTYTGLGRCPAAYRPIFGAFRRGRVPRPLAIFGAALPCAPYRCRMS